MPAGLTKDAGWEIGVSRTVNVPLDDVWEFMVSPEAVAIWLGEGATIPKTRGDAISSTDGGSGELISLRKLDRVRMKWQPKGWSHDSTLQFALSGNETSTVIRMHQENLDSEAERNQQREHWRKVLAELEVTLGD